MRRKPMQTYQQAAQAAEDMEEKAHSEALQEEEPAPSMAAEESADALEDACPPSAEAELEARFRAELEEMRLRAAAEMENFKKRLTREHQEQMRYAAEKVLGDLLPTLDNLDLALQYGSRDDVCKDMLQGVSMTRKLLQDAVARHGLSMVGGEGEEFNPEIHEAVGFATREDLPSGVVAQVLQRGYKLGERLLRPAKVMVNQ